MQKDTKTASGKVQYQQLEGGFWSIIGNRGEKLLPVNMPDQLKINNSTVQIKYREFEGASIFMWGQ